jgi:hypothetical protein
VNLDFARSVDHVEDRQLSPFPSKAALALERASIRELENKFLDGATPDVDELVGWEFRGINHTWLPRLFGIKKFVKGFYRDGERAMGYNRSVVSNALDGRWHISPKRFGFFEVTPVDPTHRDNAYLHAVLIDYGRGGNARFDPTSGLRDYLVQIDRDLYLGKGYYALGPVRVPAIFFILERHRRTPTDKTSE